MGNIKNYYFNKIDARVSNSDYWDFYLAADDYNPTIFSGVIGGSIVHYDFNESAIFSSGSTSANTIYSLTTWGEAVNTGYTATTIGLTGIDNGLVTFTKLTGDTTNTALLSALTGTTLVIASGETRLCLNSVTGLTGNYVYPIDIIIDATSTGDYARFCGGFYQGYYMLDGEDYSVFPNRVAKGWTSEFWLRKPDSAAETTFCSGYTGTTLNDTYSDNKGFFFYLGTRAENKFWNQFAGLNTGSTSGCTSGATEWCTIPKEGDVQLIDENGILIPLSPPQVTTTIVSNQFLIYDRTPDGKTVQNFTQGDSIVVSSITETVTNTTNPFLIYKQGNVANCVSSGGTETTAGTFSGFTSPLLELDKDADVIDNALGFRIKDDGSIGYRQLILSSACTTGNTTVTGVTIQEAYSDAGLITENTWEHIAIRFVADGPDLDTCELANNPARKGKLMFYVDCKLKFVVDGFDEFIASRLQENKMKQVGVPYNISLGGGSQGLIDAMTFDGQDVDDLTCNIEKYFGGSFIGDISQWRFYKDNNNYCEICNNYDQDKDRYK